MMLFLYMFVNVAMVTGLLPVVGAPLPMISYGGTAMLTVFVAFGVVASASIHDRLNQLIKKTQNIHSESKKGNFVSVNWYINKLFYLVRLVVEYPGRVGTITVFPP